MSYLYIALWVIDQNHVCGLSARVFPSPLMALSTGLWISLALRLVAFASWFLLFPLGAWAFLTVGLLSVMIDPIGVPTSRICEMQAGWMPSLLRGDVVSQQSDLAADCLHERSYRPFTFLLASLSLSSTFR